MRELSKLVDKYQERLEETYKISCTAISTKIVKRTPVDTGLARKSWTPNLNNLITGGGVRISTVINRMGLDDEYYFANGLPYIRRLEYDAWSPQAPLGMVRISAEEWGKIVEDATRKAIRKTR